ncbi:hypothetical protein OHU25_41250 [Streptomyces sp. NBC_00117]|uniref:hypothetical protein n=1 Tax=Streptomyces sp. NBC_00117 TaxID=2975657 RepID=UPI003243D4A9
MALEVIEANHVVVSHGKVVPVLDPDLGEEKPLQDNGHKLQAIQTALQVRESYRKLQGLDAALHGPAAPTPHLQVGRMCSRWALCTLRGCLILQLNGLVRATTPVVGVTPVPVAALARVVVSPR